MLEKIVVVCGPTASGKSDIAVTIAKKIDAEIVSADSMQIYKEMNIGTAKPGISERFGITHHMLDIASVCEEYNVTRFVKEANACIKDIISRGHRVVLVGGTGLYIDSLINNVSFSSADTDVGYRNELFELAKRNGSDFVYSMLLSKDPKAASVIHKNNIKRVIRALEIIKATGKTLEQVNAESIRERNYEPVFIGLNFHDRDILYDRINRRVDIMMEKGLYDEAKKLYDAQYLSATSKAAIGYKELFSHFDGDITADQAAELIKKNSRNYAKRQLTWFKRNKEINWFYPDDYDSLKELENSVIEFVVNSLEV